MLQGSAKRKGRDMREHEPMTAQQRVQLNHVVKNLHSKFRGIFGLETIEAFVFESYDDIAKRATVTKWLTVTAEKYALQRLEALAHIRDQTLKSVPAVLFLCVHNAGRSQMALGLVQPSGCRSCHCMVGRLRARVRDQPGRGEGHGRGRDRHLQGVPQALDRRVPRSG